MGNVSTKYLKTPFKRYAEELKKVGYNIEYTGQEKVKQRKRDSYNDYLKKVVK